MKKYSALIFSIFFLAAIFAQDEDFGSFGFPEESETADAGDTTTGDNNFSGNESAFSINIGGELHSGFNFYLTEFKNATSFGDVSPNLPVWGSFHINAKAPLTEAFFGVNLNDKTLPVSLGERAVVFPRPMIPLWIDEAYMQVIAGPVVFGGGVKKLTWGVADSMSVLDVINPMDYSDLSILKLDEIKIATPAFYLNAYMPLDMKLSIVYLPVFEPNRIAISGRWMSVDFNPIFKENLLSKKTNTLEYGQGGLRYNATIGGRHDIGIQYFYGFLKQPAFKVTEVKYNRYHQIGIDYVSVLGHVNVRGEFAANITRDLKGDNPFVYNPNLAWNIGLDYTFPYNIMINFQAVETIRLQQKKIKKSAGYFDIEKGLKQTDTRLIFVLSQRLVRGSLEWRLATTVGIEDKDFLIVPAVHWQFGTLLLDLDLGFFGGDKNGKLGRFRDNYFVKFSVGYKF